jgi:hypothetical protein
MGNVQGRKHKRRKKSGKRKHVKCDKLVFVDRDDGEYVWETHVVGRLPFREPEEPEIVFHCDQLWQDDDGWSMCVLVDANELSDVENVEIIEI